MLKKYAMFDENGVRSAQLIEGVNDIPPSAVLLSDSLFLQMTQETDGQWVIGSGRVISKVAFPDPPAPSAAQLISDERAWRDAELLAVTWLRDRHRDQVDIGAETTLTAEQFSELLVYMQALRDWPQSQAFPAFEQRPVAPPWVAQQNQ